MSYRKLAIHVGKENMTISLNDGRTFTGLFQAFDYHMNVVFLDCCEVKKKKMKDSRKVSILKRKIPGVVIFRGDSIVSINPPREKEGTLPSNVSIIASSVQNQVSIPSTIPQSTTVASERINMTTPESIAKKVNQSNTKTPLIPPPPLVSSVVNTPQGRGTPVGRSTPIGRGAPLLGNLQPTQMQSSTPLIPPPALGRGAQFGRGNSLGRGAPPPVMGRGSSIGRGAPIGRGNS